MKNHDSISATNKTNGVVGFLLKRLGAKDGRLKQQWARDIAAKNMEINNKPVLTSNMGATPQNVLGNTPGMAMPTEGTIHMNNSLKTAGFMEDIKDPRWAPAVHSVVGAAGGAALGWFYDRLSKKRETGKRVAMGTILGFLSGKISGNIVKEKQASISDTFNSGLNKLKELWGKVKENPIDVSEAINSAAIGAAATSLAGMGIGALTGSKGNRWSRAKKGALWGLLAGGAGAPIVKQILKAYNVEPGLPVDVAQNTEQPEQQANEDEYNALMQAESDDPLAPKETAAKLVASKPVRKSVYGGLDTSGLPAAVGEFASAIDKNVAGMPVVIPYTPGDRDLKVMNDLIKSPEFAKLFATTGRFEMPWTPVKAELDKIDPKLSKKVFSLTNILKMRKLKEELSSSKNSIGSSGVDSMMAWMDANPEIRDLFFNIVKSRNDTLASKGLMPAWSSRLLQRDGVSSR